MGGMDARPLLDTLHTVQTPEGVEITVRAAGPAARSLAWLLDLMVRAAMLMGLATVLGFLGQAGAGILLLVAFALEWIYPVLFEVLMRGQTPGKRLMGLAVEHEDGTPVSWSSSALRNLMRVADFLPFAYLGGLLVSTGDRSFRRMGDLAAGTLVVHRGRASRAHKLPPAPVLPPPVPLRPVEQRALLSFAERSASWSPERRRELAEILEPLSGASGDEGVERLIGMARWIRGER